MTRLIDHIIGDSKFALEHRALNAVLLCSTVTAFLYLPIIWVQSVFIGMLLTTISCILALSLFYYLSRFKKIFSPIILPFKISVLLIIGISWFISGGVNGTIIGLFPSAVVIFIVISPHPNHYNVVLTLSTFFLLLVLADIYLSDWITPYTSINSKYIDFTIGTILSTTIIGVTYGMLKTKFRVEQEKVSQQHQELEQANSIKAQFISNVNHELRTPMNGIVGMLSLLEQTPTNREQREYIQSIQLSSERLLNIVNEILDFSNIENSLTQINNSTFLVQEMVERVLVVSAHEAAQKGLYLLYDIDPSVNNYSYNGDLSKIERVLSNLTNNAIKFTKTGEVIVRVKQLKNKQLDFSVVDTGMGIPEEKLGTLFKPFIQIDGSNTRQFGGTGLGLAISKKFVTLLGGKITVQSQVGKGSAFSFRVPLELESRNSPQSQSDLFKGKNIVLVSPHPTLVKIIKNWLIPQGAQIHWIESFDQITTLSPNTTINIVLLDCKTPSLDPEMLNTVFADLPLILIRSSNKTLDKKELERYTDCLLTPLRYQNLYKCIQKALHLNTNIPKPLPKPNPVSQILIVDDDKMNRKLLERMLFKLGHTVDTANNGQEAVEKAQTNAYQLILMDLQMPVMDGFEASTEIMKYHSNNGHNNCPKIIAITANTLKSDKEKCFDIGMNDYLTKPITSNDLQKLICTFKF
ncbi:MAG: response regulator [Aureispira sp.]|nr:response regulator [Aureispira sp.]